MNAKGEGLFKNSNPVGTHGEQSHDPEKLNFTLPGAKNFELTMFIKDKHNVHDQQH